MQPALGKDLELNVDDALSIIRSVLQPALGVNRTGARNVYKRKSESQPPASAVEGKDVPRKRPRRGAAEGSCPCEAEVRVETQTEEQSSAKDGSSFRNKTTEDVPELEATQVMQDEGDHPELSGVEEDAQACADAGHPPMKTESSSPAKFPGHPTMNETAPVQVDSDSDGQGCEADKGCPQPDPASSGPQDPAQTMLPQAESVQACSPTKLIQPRVQIQERKVRQNPIWLSKRSGPGYANLGPPWPRFRQRPAAGSLWVWEFQLALEV